ncbi:DUF11 domain-containing protein [Diaminobutyricimonas aerilata]|nr:DUF11 domain-containing protein [Diaminobutyricimonas aerilata]
MSASAAIVSVHEITANWAAPAPASVPYGGIVVSEWHISTNDASQPESNADVANVTATLTAVNGKWGALPTVCKTTGATPASSISADGVTLVCNLGTVKAGTATVLQAGIRPTSTTGAALSANGSVTSDTATAPAGPASLAPKPITYNNGMDLVISTPSSNPAEGSQGSAYEEGTQDRQRLIVDWAIAANVGSRPGPANYAFTINLSSTTPGAVLTGITHEECRPVNGEIAAGIPFSATNRPDRANFPGCTITRLSATQYRVNLTNIDYSLARVPLKDSKGANLPVGRNYIASGALVFSNPYPVNVTTNVDVRVTAPNWTYPGTTASTVDPVANNADAITLYAPGGFSNGWLGTPASSRSRWDDQLFVAAGTGSNITLPGAGTTIAGPLPLYSQATSQVWNDYVGAGGTNLAGVCTMNQTATSLPAPENNNFQYRYFDGGGYGAGGYEQMRSIQYWYTTANINTKTFTCDQGTWTRVTPRAGSQFNDPRISNSNVMALPANVTGLKVTWNPAIDKPVSVVVRGFGQIKANAVPSNALAGEGWTVGSFNLPTGVWYNNSNIAANSTATPWSDYTGAAGGTNGYRDVFRIVGNTGTIRKTANPTTAGPGQAVTYTVRAATNSTTTPPTNSNLSVLDLLPPGMQYVAGSARLDGQPITPASTTVTGRTQLTFSITNSPANTQRVITYQALLPATSTVAPGTTLTNTAEVRVPGDNRELELRQASASIVVPANGTTTFAKSAADTYVPYAGGSSSWRMTLNSLDPSANTFTDTIDVLPYKGDENGTNIDGGYRVNTVTVPAATGWRVFATSAAATTLSDDPRTRSNGTAPGAITGNTVGWTAVPLTGTTATIPAGTTAIRVIGPALNPGAQQFFTINFSTTAPTSQVCSAPGETDNKPGQRIVNAATSYAAHTALPMRSSATTLIADCNQIQIKKYVLEKGGDSADADAWHDAQDRADYPQYGPGDTVPYRFVVTNQGTGTLTNIAVTDPRFPQCDYTIPTLAAGASDTRECSVPNAALGTTINEASVRVQPPIGAVLTGSDPAGIVVPLPPRVTKSVNPPSGSRVEPGATVTYTVTITEPADSPAAYLNPSTVDTLTDVLDDADFVEGSLTTTSSLDEDGDDATDGDPGTATRDGETISWGSSRIWPGETITLTYQVKVDDPVTGNHRLRNVVTPETGIECDTCTTENPIPGIRFTKTADVAVTHPGDVVTYTVTARNTGQVPYTTPDYPASVSDPLTDVLKDADFVEGSATNGAIFDGDSVDWTGALAVGAETSFTFQVRIKNPNPGDNRLENRVVSTTPGNNCTEDSTDPDCDATVRVQSYTVQKSTAETPVVRGNVVTYSLTVRNTGEVPYTGTGADVASFSDDLADVLDDADFTGTPTGGAVFADGRLTWAGPLAVGETRTFTYTVTVKQTPNPDSLVLNNTVTPTGPGGSCAAAGACDTSTPIAQFHVAKSADPAYTNPGGTVHYTIVVENTGAVDFTDAFPASFRDSFSDVLDDGELVGIDDDGDIIPGTITWTAGDVTYSGATLAWVGPLPVDGTVTIEYDVLVDNPDRGDHLLKNTITTPPGIANCDTGSTDPDCGTETPVQSYELVKAADKKVVEVGDTVNYTITVRNTGRVPYPAGPGEPQASIADPIDDVLLNADFDGIVNATAGTATWDAAAETIRWVGDLPVDGAPVTITYAVTIHTAAVPPDRIVNRAQTTTIGGNCDPTTDVDLADPRCQVEVPTRSYKTVKTVSDPIVEPGQQNLTYTITVTNTGAEAYLGTEIGDEDAAEIRDDLNDILGDSGNPVLVSQPAGWDVEFTGGVLTAAGPLAVDETVTFVYTVDIDEPDEGDHRLENRVETPPGRGGNCTPFSTDGDCDATVLVREYTTEKTVTPEVVEVGDTVVYTIEVVNTGQVAYDGLTPDTSASLTDDLADVLDDATFGAVLQGGATFDAASETLTWSGPLPIGGTHLIRYTVIATGADEHVLINGVEPGPTGRCVDAGSCDTEVRIRSFEYEKSVDAEAAVEGQTLTYTITVRNTGAVAYTDEAPADIADDLSGVLDDAGELSDPVISPAGAGEATIVGSSILWEGPLALPGQAGDEVTITYTVTVDDPDTGDHLLVNAVTSENGVCAEAGGCTTTTPVRSYLVEKVSTPATTLPGGIVEYTITVTNTGAVAYTDADPASLVDDLSDVLDVAGDPTDLAVAGDSDNLPTFADGELRWAGELPVGGVVTLTYRVQVDATLAADADYLLENVVEPTATGGECGICSTVTPIRAYSTVKKTDRREARIGDVVTYTVTVTNTGQVAYAAPLQATFTDDLTDVLDDATGPQGLGAGATFDPATGVLTWAGDLPIGATTTVTYSVVVGDPAVTGGDGILENAVLTPPEGGCAESTAPDCKTITPIRSLHYAKTVSTGVALPGDVVEYTIAVRNTGAVAFTDADPAQFDDALTRILDDVTPVTEESLALEASAGTASYDETLRSIHWEGPLAPGATATVTYQVQIANPNRGDNRLANKVVSPPGVPSNCAAESVDPDCATETLVKSFRVEKTADKTEFFPGDRVTYTIRLTNTGEVAYDDAGPVVWTDDLTEVLDDAVYNDDATGGVTWNGTETLSWTGPLAVGQVMEFTYSVTVRNPIPGDKVLYNRVVSPTEGSNCAETSADPLCEVDLGGPSVRTVKTSSKETAFPGDVVEYAVTITNDGGIDWTDARPAMFDDNLAAVLDDATYNGDVEATLDGDVVPGAEVSGTILHWQGPLARGESVIVTYSVTINAPVSGDGILDNVVTTPEEVPSNCTAMPSEPSPGEGEGEIGGAAAGDPTSSSDPDCATRTLVKSYVTTKTSDAAGKVKPGDRITYTITVVNNGQVDYTDEQPASFVDDFSQVLDDATYAGDAPAGTTYVAPTLTWNGALAVGDITIVTYSFVVNENGGDNRMINAVLADSEIGGGCATETGCTTTIEIVRPLAATGAFVLPIVGGVLALIGAGGLLFWIGRRRRLENQA